MTPETRWEILCGKLSCLPPFHLLFNGKVTEVELEQIRNSETKDLSYGRLRKINIEVSKRLQATDEKVTRQVDALKLR